MSNILEKRVVTALADDTMSSALEALLQEVETAIVASDEAAKLETERAFDPVLSPDPAKARAAMEDATFAANRLRTLRPRLEARLIEVQSQERLKRWHSECDALEVERDELMSQWGDTYPKVVAALIDLFSRSATLDEALSRLHQARPAGVTRHLVGAEERARGIERFTRDEPSVTRELKLPDWDQPTKMVWPPHRPIDPALITPMAVGDPRLCTGDWWQVKQEEERARREQEAREAAEREAKALENYHGPRWWKGERA